MMSEEHSSEVEKVLLYIGDARQRARRAAEKVGANAAAPEVIAALEEAEQALGAVHRQLSREAIYAIPDDRLRLTL